MLDKKMCKSIVAGQTMSLFVSFCSLSSSLLVRPHGVNTPTLQSVPTYALLALFATRSIPFLSSMLYSTAAQASSKEDASSWMTSKAFWTRAWSRYLPLAIIDVEANFIIISAFQYTDVAAIMLIDCWAIPCCMLLSYLFLGLRYGNMHFLGAGMCVLGIVILVVVDYVTQSDTESPNPLLGDLLVLLGATLYAISNVGQEFMVASRPRAEFMGMLGLFGLPLAAGQAFLVEYDRIMQIPGGWDVVFLFAVFAIFQFGQYVLAPSLLRWSGAAFFNLSLLTSDVFAMIISVVLFGRPISVQFVISGVIILGGIVIYEMGPEPAAFRETIDDKPENEALIAHDKEAHA